MATHDCLTTARWCGGGGGPRAAIRVRTNFPALLFDPQMFVTVTLVCVALKFYFKAAYLHYVSIIV